jgi:hypothetical protein
VLVLELTGDEVVVEAGSVVDVVAVAWVVGGAVVAGVVAAVVAGRLAAVVVVEHACHRPRLAALASASALAISSLWITFVWLACCLANPSLTWATLMSSPSGSRYT